MDELTISASYVRTQPFRIGATLREAFGVLVKRLPLYLAISAAANLPLLWAHYQLGIKLGSTRRENLLLQLAVEGVWGGVYQAIVVAAVLQHLSGGRSGLVKPVRRVLARLAPVTATSLLTVIVVCAGLILLVVPGVIASIALTVTAAACVVERIGPFQSVSRSFALTNGRKDEIFVALLSIAVIDAGVSAALRFIAEQEGSVAPVAALFVWEVAVWAYFAIVSVLIYRDLRAEKEGVDLGQTASVFD